MTITPTTPSNKNRFGWSIILLVLIFFGLPTIAHLYTDFLWFQSINLRSIYSTIISTKITIGFSVGIIVYILILINLRLASYLSKGLSSLFLHDPDGVARLDFGSVATRIINPISIGIGLFSGAISQHYWDLCLKFLNSSRFGIVDPIFKNDIGFYIFQLPFVEAVTSILMWTLGTTMVAVLGFYWARGALTLTSGTISFHRPARTHLSIIAMFIFLILAVEGYLDLLRLLYSTTGPMTGASYADVNATMPAMRIKIATSVVAAMLVAISITREKLSLIVTAISLYIGVHLIGVELYSYAIQHFRVEPNELDKEAPFLQYNIDATRRAYGLDKVTERELSGDLSLTLQDINRNQDTLENIRLWDHQPLLDTFAQIQEIRTYYDFHSVDNDRYLIDGKLMQTMLSPRELSSTSLPNRTWINERFTFTHGYGLTLGPVNKATPEGLPVLLIQDMPPSSVHDSVRVSQPAIYYGELSNDYVFVQTNNKEFHHPSAEGNVYKNYNGKGGIRFSSTFIRLAIAARLGSLKILLSDDISNNSRVLIYRKIQDRVRRIAPFLRFDYDPYMVVREDGTIIWIYDAYTTSNRYPYAEPTRNGFNYIRNSVKIVIDAYNGTVNFYVADENDPIIRTWMRIFPNVFVPLSKMPPDIRKHLRYPEDIFKIQTEMFTVYHMDHPQLLYNREDQWEMPTISSGDSSMRMEPYYMIMKLPGETDAEFILMLPFTPKRKDNLAAWMVARADGDKLGSLIIYRFPKDRLVFGPKQIVNRINQDAEISRQISLWDQRGSEALFGTLLVIPIEESLIYVRPLYLRSEGGKIPELKRVIVVYENRIAMKPSLQEAMDSIFDNKESDGKDVAASATDSSLETSKESPDRTAPLIQTGTKIDKELPKDPRIRAFHHFRNAIDAQRSGNWALYGKELEQVEKYLKLMQPNTNP